MGFGIKAGSDYKKEPGVFFIEIPKFQEYKYLR